MMQFQLPRQLDHPPGAADRRRARRARADRRLRRVPRSTTKAIRSRRLVRRSPIASASGTRVASTRFATAAIAGSCRNRPGELPPIPSRQQRAPTMPTGQVRRHHRERSSATPLATHHMGGKDARPVHRARRATTIGLIVHRPQRQEADAACYDASRWSDYFKSGMSEYDSSYVYVPLELPADSCATMEDRVTSIQIKVKDYNATPTAVVETRCKSCSADVPSRSRPGRTSRGRSWRRSPSSRASSTCCCSSSSPWRGSASWRSSR